MTPTPEEIEQLRISGETLSAIAAKAARVDELETTLEACRDDLMNVSQTAADRNALIQRLNLAVSEQAVKADRFRQQRDEARGATLPIGEPAFALAAQTIDRLQGEILVLEDKRSSLMMEVDRLTTDNQRLGVYVVRLTGELGEAKADLGRAGNDLETERNRLAACGVIALADTPQSAVEARKMHPSYRSASLSDVERRVDECIRLRAELAEARATLATCQASNRSLFGQVEEVRAENGRQAATIAKLRNDVDTWRDEFMKAESRANALELQGESNGEGAVESNEEKPTIEDVLGFMRKLLNSSHILWGNDNSLTADDKLKIDKGRAKLGLPLLYSAEEYTATPPPLRLEVGKTYVRRDGGREKIVFHDAHGAFFPSAPFKAASGKLYYADGLSRPGHWSHADLVAEAPTS